MGRLVDCDKVYNAIQITTDNFGVAKQVVQSNMLTMLSKIPTADAILIPKGATNGDMIKAVFGAEDIDEDFMLQIITVTMSDARKTFGRDWWYAPYKKEG